MSEQPRFWNLHWPEAGPLRLVQWAEDVDWEEIRCPRFEGHSRAGKRIGNRVVLPPRIGDFAFTMLAEYMIQDHVLRRFLQAGLTGFDVKPIEVVRIYHRARRTQAGGDKSPAGIPCLWELVINGWAGEAPLESGIRMVSYCETCRYRRYSGCTNPLRLIDPRQWDGSDFFIVWPLPKYIFLSDRAAQLIREEGYTGCRLLGIEQLEPGKVSDGFSPGDPPPGKEISGPEAFPGCEILR